LNVNKKNILIDMKKEKTWIDLYRSKLKREELLLACSFLVPFILAFVFGFLGGKLVTYVDKDGTRVVESTGNPLFVCLAVIFGVVSCVMLILSFVRVLHTRIDVAQYKEHTMLSYVTNKKCLLVIDGVEAEKVTRLNYRDFVVLNGVTSTGIEVTLKVTGKESHFTYRDLNKEGQTVIINTYNKSRRKKDKDDLTPIQKKLLEQAKTDALAGINAANPEESKEKIDLYNKLDELDD